MEIGSVDWESRTNIGNGSLVLCIFFVRKAGQGFPCGQRGLSAWILEIKQGRFIRSRIRTLDRRTCCEDAAERCATVARKWERKACELETRRKMAWF